MLKRYCPNSKGNMNAWVDIWIENEDIICDWNQKEKYHTIKDSIQVK